MDSRMKLSALLLGGYLLGRTKKGGTALRLATSLATSGQQARPGELLRDNLMRTVQSAETQELIQGLRAQITEALQATLDARIAQLSQSLNDRTEQLTRPVDASQETDDEQPEDSTEEKPEDSTEEKPDENHAEEPTDEDEDSGAVEATKSHTEEPAEVTDEAEGDEANDELEERVEELKGLRITSLRKMARELRYDDEEVAQAEKNDLAWWIAEGEAEDEASEAEATDEIAEAPEEPEQVEEPEEPEPPRKKAPARAERERADA